MTKYCYKSSYGLNGFTDNKTVLDASDDAATANWGNGWRMPTLDEIQELYSNCSSVWTTQNGVMGRLFTGPNGNTLFLPAVGYYDETSLYGADSDIYYWSSTLRDDYPSGAPGLKFDSYNMGYEVFYRFFKGSVRPVVNPNPNVAYLGLNLYRKSVEATGEEFTVNVTSNKVWSVSCDQSWVTFSATSGSGNGSFSVLVAANESKVTDNATITVSTAKGHVTRIVGITRYSQPQDGTLQGHDYVDLGLPSGTLWATCNVGANSPEEYGDYFAWGETSPKSNYDWFTYKYGTDYNNLTKYCTNRDYGGYCTDGWFIDNKTVLDAEDDAASVKWGSNWRMPTCDEIKELKNNCSSIWTIRNGMNGRLFTGPNGNTLFLPAAGYYDETSLYGAGSNGNYWSSTLENSPDCACALDFDWDKHNRPPRFLGRSVRPVAKQLAIAPTQKSVGAAGGSFEVTVTSTTSWSVTANQPLVTLSANSGSGNGSFSVLVAANETDTSDNATITVTTATGNVTQTVAITRAGVLPVSGAVDGHDYVDLGLPSGTLWATCNVGANTSEEYGDYFAWGETTPKSKYSWKTYKYGTDDDQLTKYCDESSYGKNGLTDNKTTLDAEDDAATANWGSGWRMPTLAEIQELEDNATATWITQNGVSGCKFTASNGNSIFLPAAGYYRGSHLYDAGSGGNYWSGSLGTDNPGYAYILHFGVYGYDNDRYLGQSVRPVVKQTSSPFELRITPVQQLVMAAGESFEVTVTSTTSWSVTANQPLVTLSANSGSGNGSFSVLVAANETDTSDNATITVTTATGNVTQTVAITRAGVLPVSGAVDGHDYVDLGLPSGTLWATCNVGANTSEEYGDYFAWGETTPKSKYSWKTYKYGTDDDQLTKYCDESSYGKNGLTDNKTTLDAEDDAATANWGSGWRMPTLAEIQELEDNATATWITQNGVSGCKFTASNGNSIFLPAAGDYDGSDLKYAGGRGYYWSGSLSTEDPFCAYNLDFGSDDVGWDCDYSRFCGRSVRPVVKR